MVNSRGDRDKDTVFFFSKEPKNGISLIGLQTLYLLNYATLRNKGLHIINNHGKFGR